MTFRLNRRLAQGQKLAAKLAIGLLGSIVIAGCATKRFVQSESMAIGDAALANWLFERLSAPI